MADIFISYSSEDKTIVKNIAHLLEDKGWTVWWDRQIPIGQKYDTVIETELQNAACVLVVWTQRSVTSEWVKNEASEAAQKNILVPVVLDQVNIPLAFRRIESAMLIGWDGEDDHPELEILYHSIAKIINNKNEPANDSNNNTAAGTAKRRQKLIRPVLMATAGLVALLLLVYYYVFYFKDSGNGAPNRQLFYLLLFCSGISVGILVLGLMKVYAVIGGERIPSRFKFASPAVGLLLVIFGGLYLPSGATEATITVRIFDWKKNPITQGDVKIYLPEYIRTQSIDKMGQALFTGIPASVAKTNMKIEVSSPGFATRSFDTLLVSSKLLELTLPFTTVVTISGQVKTAAEMPIKGVEIDVEGTRYYAMTITDGSYTLRLEEYTLGDEIKLTTSHKNFEDKTIKFTINSPDIQKKDIFLNPITK